MTRNTTEYLEKVVLAGGEALRVHKTKGLFFKNTTIKQMVKPTRGGHMIHGVSYAGEHMGSQPNREVEAAITAKNIITAFQSSVDRYIKSGISNIGYSMNSDGDHVPKSCRGTLEFCHYMHNNSFFRWRSDGSKKTVKELQKILQQPLEEDEKAQKLITALQLNFHLIGGGLHQIFVLHELLSGGGISTDVRLSTPLNIFLETRRASAAMPIA